MNLRVKTGRAGPKYANWKASCRALTRTSKYWSRIIMRILDFGAISSSCWGKIARAFMGGKTLIFDIFYIINQLNKWSCMHRGFISVLEILQILVFYFRPDVILLPFVAYSVFSRQVIYIMRLLCFMPFMVNLL